MGWCGLLPCFVVRPFFAVDLICRVGSFCDVRSFTSSSPIDGCSSLLFRRTHSVFHFCLIFVISFAGMVVRCLVALVVTGMVVRCLVALVITGLVVSSLVLISSADLACNSTTMYDISHVLLLTSWVGIRVWLWRGETLRQKCVKDVLLHVVASLLWETLSITVLPS